MSVSPPRSTPRWASIVAFYGATQPAAFADAVAGVQADLAVRLGASYLPRPTATVHSTLIGLDVLGPLDSSDDLRARFRDGGGADVRGFAGHLRAVLEDEPLTVQLGGFPDRDLGLTSRGLRPYQRSVAVDRDQVVLIGWPVDAAGRPLMVLDRLRRAAARFGIEHRYPLSETAHDPDAHVVVGELVEAVPTEVLAAAVTAARAALVGRPRRVPLRWDDLAVVAYDDTRLPLDTTVTVPCEDVASG